MSSAEPGCRNGGCLHEDAGRGFWSTTVRRFAREAALNSFYATRAERAAGLLPPAGRSLRVLDVGLGAGHLVLRLTQLGHHVVGTELSEGQLDSIREQCDPTTVDLRLGGLEVIGFSERFDSVFAIGLLPYIADQPAFVRALSRHVDVKGRLILSITRPNSLYAWLELMRHVPLALSSAHGRWIAMNLLLTGIWSGGFVARKERHPIRDVSQLTDLLRERDFELVDQFSLFNVRRLDKSVAERGRVGRRLAAMLGWCTVASYERRG